MAFGCRQKPFLLMIPFATCSIILLLQLKPRFLQLNAPFLQLNTQILQLNVKQENDSL